MTTQELYLQLKEGKISNEKFLYEVRRDNNLPWVTNLTSFDDAVQILKNKSIITEAKIEQEETPKQVLLEARDKKEEPKDVDHIIWDQYQRGIKYELEKQGDLDLEKAQKKALANINKDPLYYFRLVNGQKIEKKRSDTMEYVDKKMSNMVDERNQMEIAKKDAKANVQDTLGKKEKGTKKPKKVKIMSIIPKKSKGVKVMDIPGKPKVMKLKEALELNENIQDRADEINAFARLVKAKQIDDIVDVLYTLREFPEEHSITSKDANIIIAKYLTPAEQKEVYDVLAHNINYTDPAGGTRGLSGYLEEELNEGSIEINGKTVKTYTQNGDKSYNVTYDDGTKDRIAVSNDAWDKINTLHQNAIKLKEAYVNPQGQLNMEDTPEDILAIIKEMFFFNNAEAMAFYNNNKETFEEAIDMGLNPKAAVETVAFFNTQLNEETPLEKKANDLEKQALTARIQAQQAKLKQISR